MASIQSITLEPMETVTIGVNRLYHAFRILADSIPGNRTDFERWHWDRLGREAPGTFANPGSPFFIKTELAHYGFSYDEMRIIQYLFYKMKDAGVTKTLHNCVDICAKLVENVYDPIKRANERRLEEILAIPPEDRTPSAMRQLLDRCAQHEQELWEALNKRICSRDPDATNAVLWIGVLEKGDGYVYKDVQTVIRTKLPVNGAEMEKTLRKAEMITTEKKRKRGSECDDERRVRSKRP